MTSLQTISDRPDTAGRATEKRFAFGKNWSRFLRLLDEDRIVQAEASLKALLGVPLAGRTLVDVGSGSGLFSLAARRLGATVHSFDYDTDSVACTAELRRRYFPGDSRWTVDEASILDLPYVESLGSFDVAYSWGVLHHTGDMWTAIDHTTRLVAPNGTLAIAIYNDQGAWSRRWRSIKRTYCSGTVGRVAVCATCIPALALRGLASDLIRLRSPRRRYVEYARNRGMSVLHDWVDWLGGYPFEVAKPEEIFDALTARGFQLKRLRTCGGTVGCNEFVFDRQSHVREVPGTHAGHHVS